MAGGLPMPANQTFLSFREEGHAMPLRMSPVYPENVTP